MYRQFRRQQNNIVFFIYSYSMEGSVSTAEHIRAYSYFYTRLISPETYLKKLLLVEKRTERLKFNFKVNLLL